MSWTFSLRIGLVIAACALSSAAMAQSRGADQVSNPFPNPPTGSTGILADPPSPGDNQARLRESYDLSIMMLKKKMDRLTREDGGQLTAEHQAGLQRELDAVNRRFHAGRLAQ